MADVLPPPCGDLLGEHRRRLWCGDTDLTGHFVCRRVRGHKPDRHVGRNDVGGIHQWPAQPVRQVGEATVDPVGTVRVHPDDDRLNPGARRRIAVDASDYAGPYEGCRWQRLTGVGVGDGGCDPLHSRDVAGWPVQPLAELAVVLGHPAVDGDLRERILTAVTAACGYESWAEAESVGNGGEAKSLRRIADSVLAVVQPVLDRQANEIADHWRAAGIDDGTKAELAEENLRLREAVRVAESLIAGRDAEIADIYRSANVTMREAEACIVEKLRGMPLRPGINRLSEAEAVTYADAVAMVAGPVVEGLHAEAARLTRELDDARAELASERRVYADKPEDRLWHDADQTWWRRAEDGRLVRGEAPLEVERLTRERDEARAQAEGFYSATRRLASMFWLDPEAHQTLDVLGSIAEQLAAWRSDATQVPEGWQSLVRKGWSVGASRPAIPADRPRVVCLCGSMRFEDEIREAAREESLSGHIVVLPLCNMKQPHPLWADEATAEVLKANLDALHKAKIDLADEIVVVSDASGYIGESTRSEIAYAEAHGKEVRYWRPTRQWTDSTGILWQEAQPGFVHVVSPMTGQPHMFGEPVELEKVEAKFGPLTAAVPTPDTDTTKPSGLSTPTVEHWITQDGHRLREHKGKLWFWGHPDASGNMAWFEDAFPNLDAVRRQGHTLTLVPGRSDEDTTEVPGER